MTSIKNSPAFASAENVSAADELLDHLVAFRPIESKAIETKLGISEATISQTILISEDGTATDLGERPVFWQVVRRQLAQASAKTPWIAGRFVQSGQAFKLETLTEADAGVVSKALKSLA
jgi:hypothetical protein